MTIAYHAHSASPSSSTGAPHWYHLHFAHFEPDILSHNNLKLSSWMFPIRVSTSLLETRFPSSNPRVQTWQVCRKQSLPFFLFETSNFTKVNLNMVNHFFWMYIIFPCISGGFSSCKFCPHFILSSFFWCHPTWGGHGLVMMRDPPLLHGKREDKWTNKRKLQFYSMGTAIPPTSSNLTFLQEQSVRPKQILHVHLDL